MGRGGVGEGRGELADMLLGITASETHITWELLGPPETSHFLVVRYDRRIAVNTIDGFALLTVGGGAECPVVPSLPEAWSGAGLVKSASPRDFC